MEKSLITDMIAALRYGQQLFADPGKSYHKQSHAKCDIIF